MNGIARVFVSVVLLGACAAAMRLTMVDFNAELTMRTVKYGVDSNSEIQIRFEAPDIQNKIQIVKRDARGIQVTLPSARQGLWLNPFDAIKANGQWIYRSTVKTFPDSDSKKLNGLFGLPKLDGTLLAQLPPRIPIEFNVYAYAPHMEIDLRGLQISKFDLNPDIKEPLPIALEVFAPNSSFSGQTLLRTKNRPVSLQIAKGIKGTIGILAAGTSEIQILIERRVKPRIVIYKANHLLTPDSLWNGIDLPESLKKKSTLTFVGNEYEANSLLPRQPIGDLYNAPEDGFDCTIRIFLDPKGKLTIKTVEQL
jgi:hypothetical protein